MAKKKSRSRAKVAKRAQNALEIAEKEMAGNESGSDGNFDFEDDNGPVVNLLRKVRGDDADGSDEDSFEDEELDSDEALGSDDDYDVLNSKMSQTIRDRKKNKNSVSSEDEGGYTSIDEADLVPLSQVWDMDEKDANADSDEDGPETKLQLRGSDEEDVSSEQSGDSSSDDEDDDDDDDDDEDEDPFDEISEDEEDVELNTITNDLLKQTEKRAYKKLDNYGSGKDSEFSLPTGGSTKRINLVDMMSAVDDKEAASNAKLIQKDSSALSVPLPQRIQERHNRKAAYEISKKEVERWQDVVQQNRRAEHLSFPMNPAAEHNHASTFTRSSEEPKTKLQEKVDSVLKESNLVGDQRNATFEELATAKISPEEMKKRTSEMRLMRELMFREERKAKRLKKIKSKTYRRIKKKEMLKNKELAGLSDESDEDHEAARARERMTLKHRANSKWSKDMVKHGMANDQETREEIEEMLRQGERLKEKMLDHDSEQEDNVSLSDLEVEDREREGQKKHVGKTGVLDMAFMKNAAAREREAYDELLAELRSGREHQSEDEEQDSKPSFEEENIVQVNKGRRIYASGDSANSREKSTVKNVPELKDGEIVVTQDETPAVDPKRQEKQADKSSNPWLNESDGEDNGKVVRSSTVSIVDKDSSKLVKSANKLEKASEKQKRKSGKGIRQDEDLLLDLDTTNRLGIVDPYAGSDGEDSGFMFKQQKSISEAFAGDEVVDQFEEEKKRVAIDEDDKEEDVTLPGWGSWAGNGANPKKKRKFIKKIKGVASQDKRKDKNLKNVIINEKVNKKNLKYQSSAVPFPFESREQYERSLRMPLGQEWTSRGSHQKLIKPRILTKPSQIISPLKAPFK